jgi:hypothetical protein
MNSTPINFGKINPKSKKIKLEIPMISKSNSNIYRDCERVT